MPPLPPVTKALLLICTAVYCVQLLLPPGVVSWFVLQPVLSGRFMPWQLVTYAFLHANAVHLFFNMLGLWMFGAELEDMWGRKRFMQFLLACALTGAVAHIPLSMVFGGAGPTVGASGALYGLLLAFAMTFPDRIIMPLFPPIPMKAKIFVAVFGALELFNGVFGSTGVAHFAHLGGMLGGFLMLRYWRGQPPFGRRRRY